MLLMVDRQLYIVKIACYVFSNTLPPSSTNNRIISPQKSLGEKKDDLAMAFGKRAILGEYSEYQKGRVRTLAKRIA